MSESLKATALYNPPVETPLTPTYVPPGEKDTKVTCVAAFESVKPQLSEKPLRRPPRTRPIRDLANEQLQRISALNPPSADWFEGEEERPF